ncbi:cysteine-rich PDZ-binding protein [Caerostris darwini]|uniref:Cysteine-rich PDZ-binding protein n=1 Tax=Caerostris darwini TaxID=1538125 RepID=A0AAV4SDD1_9ARAC|nr:cysteine-rich PDZ-binding protein [Caerostris darwini]
MKSSGKVLDNTVNIIMLTENEIIRNDRKPNVLILPTRFSPYEKFATCKICRQKVHQAGSHYCQACAYKKGICAMCGKKLLDTKNYKQSSA